MLIKCCLNVLDKDTLTRRKQITYCAYIDRAAGVENDYRKSGGPEPVNFLANGRFVPSYPSYHHTLHHNTSCQLYTCWTHGWVRGWMCVMTSSNGNIFRVTGPLWVEFTGHGWIPLTKASDAELWCFLWSAPEQTFEQTIETQVIWDAIAVIMTAL